MGVSLLDGEDISVLTTQDVLVVWVLWRQNQNYLWTSMTVETTMGKWVRIIRKDDFSETILGTSGLSSSWWILIDKRRGSSGLTLVWEWQQLPVIKLA